PEILRTDDGDRELRQPFAVELARDLSECPLLACSQDLRCIDDPTCRIGILRRASCGKKRQAGERQRDGGPAHRLTVADEGGPRLTRPAPPPTPTRHAATRPRPPHPLRP